jgi:helicase
MVVGDETQRYSLTAVGQITAQHGILPETGHYFTSWLKSYFSGEDTEIPSLLHLLFTLARSPDAQVRPFPRPRNVRGAQQNGSDIIDRLRSEILEQSHNGRLPTDLQRFFESETGFSPQDRLVAHKTLAMWDWINDASTRDLESRYHLMAGGFQQHGRDFQWLAETLAALAASLNLSADLVQSLSNLARRLPLGLIEPAMSLAPLARAGLIRDDAHRLCPEGWNTLEALADVPLELLQNVIPVYKARPLQELSGQLVARYRENQSLLQSLTKSATQAEPTKPVSDPTATRGETLMTPNESEQNELSMLSGEISEDAENTASGKQPNQLAIMLSRQPNGEVVINGERHPLKPISSQLLYLLAENLGKCVSYKEIALKIWGTHKLGGNDQIHQHKAELLKVFKNAIRKDGTAALVLRTIPRHGLCLNLKPDQFQWVE